MLATELAAIGDQFDLELLCFDADELQGLLEPEPQGATEGEDEAPEPEAIAATLEGDGRSFAEIAAFRASGVERAA